MFQFLLALCAALGGGFLGITAHDTDTGRVVVDAAVAGSPAAAIGIRSGDIIASVDDHKVGSLRGLIEILDGYEPGDRVELEVIRGDARRFYSVRLDPRPATERDGGPPGVLEADVEIQVEAEPVTKGIEWFEGGFKKALAKAKKSGRPLIIDFYADWCGPCREMDATTFQDAGVSKLSRKFIAVRVNVDNNSELADKFGVSSIPDVRLLDATGKQITQMTGYREADNFAGALKRALGEKKGGKKKGLLERRREKKSTQAAKPGDVVFEWEGPFEGADLEKFLEGIQGMDLDLSDLGIDLEELKGGHPRGIIVSKKFAHDGHGAEEVEVDVQVQGSTDLPTGAEGVIVVDTSGGFIERLEEEIASLRKDVSVLRKEVAGLKQLLKEVRGLLD